MNGGSDRDRNRLNAYQIKARYLKLNFQLFTFSPLSQEKGSFLFEEYFSTFVVAFSRGFRGFFGIFVHFASSRPGILSQNGQKSRKIHEIPAKRRQQTFITAHLLH